MTTSLACEVRRRKFIEIREGKWPNTGITSGQEERLAHADAFFGWLVSNLDGLFHDHELQKTLAQKLGQIDPSIRWEVGPFDATTNFFAFSPNLDIELLPLTEALAELAPIVPGWIFLPAKPRKAWKSRSIELKDGGGQLIRYNLDNWLYYLTAFNDGEFFDVNLVPRGYEDKPLDDLRYVGCLFVECELGERVFMEFVDRVNIVLPSELTEYGNKIEDLHDQIMQELEKNVRH